MLYQTVGANARGQIEKAYLGDGSRTTRNFVKGTERLAFTNAAMGAAQPVQNFVYTYDAIGNVSGRGDLINSLSEAFGYDALDRLTSSTVTNGTGAHPVTYQYDANGLGNLTHKSDTSTLPSASMTYSTTARPHAVTSLNTGSATRNFTYNANGSMLTGQVDSAARTLTWTSDELPATVTIGSISRTFSYGADRQRYKQVWVSAAGTRTYTYAGEHYVKEVQGSATEHKLYLYANGEQIGYVSDDGTPETRYFHKDHLGSITTIVTNQTWSGREKLSYDAWGKRRSATDWWSAASTASEERGYTGHEHLDDVSLIHMNGRLLDPKLGRVISADPTVPDPLYSQSYNRFSYVYNNPLKYTDPSGFGPCDYIALCGLARGIKEHMTSCRLGECGSRLGGVDSGYIPSMSQEYMDTWLAAFFAWQNEPPAEPNVVAVKGPANDYGSTDQGGKPPTVMGAVIQYQQGAGPTSAGPMPGETPYDTTKRLFRKNEYLQVSASGQTLTISGYLYSFPRYHAEQVKEFVLKAFKPTYVVNGQTVSVNVDLRFATLPDSADILVEAVTAKVPTPEEARRTGSELGFRAFAHQGGSVIKIWANGSEPDYTLPHEFLHTLGFADMYRDDGGGFPGHEDDIMNAPGGMIQPYHIQVLMEVYGR